MTQKSEHIQAEREVVFMIDPEAQFVSLVTRGANQVPWRIVKNQKEAAMPKKVLAKLVAPKGTDVEAIKSAMGNEAGNALKFETKIERGEMDIYDQMPLTALKSDTIEMITLNKETGLKGIAGELADEDKSGMFGIFKSQTPKGVALEGDFEALDESALKAQYSDQLYGELYAYFDGVQAIMAQEKGDPGKKLAAIKTMTSALMEHITEALSVTKEEALEIKAPAQKSDDADPAQKSDEAEADPAQKSDEAEADPAQKSDEAEADPAQKSEQDEDEGTQQKSDEQLDDGAQKSDDSIASLIAEGVAAGLKPLQAEMTTLKESLDSMQSDVSKMQKRVPGVITDTATDDVENAQKSEDKGSFSGCLFSRP